MALNSGPRDFTPLQIFHLSLLYSYLRHIILFPNLYSDKNAPNMEEPLSSNISEVKKSYKFAKFFR